MTIARLRDNALLWIFALYLIMNQGFMQVRIPPGGASGVPIGELVLIGALVSINHGKTLPEFARTVFVLPFVLWWGLGLSRALLGFSEYGFWALRDAVHVIESLFVYVGFAFALNPQSTERFFRWIKILMIVAGVYVLFYPFSETLQSFSPQLMAAAGEERALFFQYQGFFCVGLWVAAYLLIFHARGARPGAFLLAGALVAFLVIFFQARTLYLQIFTLSLLFILFKRQAFGKITLIVLLGVTAIAVLPLLNLEIATRFGGALSLEFFTKHFLTTFGEAAKGVEGAAYGTNLRVFWWRDILSDVTGDPLKFLFGLGYGFPLVKFFAYEIQVREPHNSYVSILGRIGTLGVVSFVWMQAVLFARWGAAYRACKRLDWQLGANRLLFLLCFFAIVLLMATTEDGFEKPFFTIPYYFCWGVMLAIARNVKEGVYVPRPAALAVRPVLGAAPGRPALLRPPADLLRPRLDRRK